MNLEKLDSVVMDENKSFPKTKEDVLLYVRGNLANKKLVFVSNSETDSMIITLVEVALQNPEFAKCIKLTASILLDDANLNLLNNSELN